MPLKIPRKLHLQSTDCKRRSKHSRTSVRRNRWRKTLPRSPVLANWDALGTDLCAKHAAKQSRRAPDDSSTQPDPSSRAKQCQSDAVPKAVLPCPWHTLMQPSAKALRKQEQRQSSLSAGLHVLSIFLYLLTFLLELTAFSFSFTWKPFSNPSEAGFEGISCFSTHCHPNFKALQSYCFNNSYDKI